jgi:hypothetical protein
MEPESGDTVFILVPRHDSICKATHVKKTLSSLYALDKAKVTAEIRAKTRITVAENKGKCATVGVKPNRGSPGVKESWPKKFSQDEKEKIIKQMTGCKDVAKSYLPLNNLWGLGVAKVLGDWPKICGGAPKSIYGSLASALNHYLNIHTNEAFFYS